MASPSLPIFKLRLHVFFKRFALVQMGINRRHSHVPRLYRRL